ncbi:hypothetical protein MgSA37_01850 [Mucilaginibacter gotjawali]|uniref:Uncharacterized protein n=2 Tax=Mucilaginibacter gotjawali TaxID=1550579 RepID=A0A120MXR3_9SPHI|nr:hypothetical protein MgSA37_01850 [Mucilaginibacter gotjawali]
MSYDYISIYAYNTMKKIFYFVLPLSAILAGCSPIVYTSTQPVANQQPRQPQPPQQTYADQPQTDQVFTMN